MATRLEDIRRLTEIILRGDRLVIFLHDHPDPDAIAAGWILKRIGQHLGVRTRIVHGGRMSRAENQAMVRLLRIPIQSLERKPIRYLGRDVYALLDTQPGTGNNSFPHDRYRAHIVIDHHGLKPWVESDFLEVRTDVGACTTLLLALHRKLGLPVDSALATAAAYAIITETQDLEREATQADRNAFLWLFPLIQWRILGRVRHPRRKRSYYQTIARAMRQVTLVRKACICHVGPIYAPEAVGEIADFLAAMEGVRWCLVTGFQDGCLTLSLRTADHKRDAASLTGQLLGQTGKGGGHGMSAGGLIACLRMNDYEALTDSLTNRFIEILFPGERPEIQPLLPEK